MTRPKRHKTKKKTNAELDPFNERLARLRKMAGYTQRSLAAETGVSHRMIAYYEGKTARPPARLLPVFAKALGVTIDQLLGIDKVSPRKKPRNQRLMRQLRKVEQLSARSRRSVIDHIEALWQTERGAARRSE